MSISKRGNYIMFKPRPIEILLVEDNPGDIRLTREALLDSKIFNNLSVVIDGVEALKFIRKEEEYESVETPDLILLDLNLPKLDGRQVLAAIKEMKDKTGIPVIVLTTSDDENDIIATHNLGANHYITKPVMLENFIEIVRNIDNFWIAFVRLTDEEEKSQGKS